MLHWPPIQPGIKDYSSIFENEVNVSIAFLKDIFPDFFNGFAFDLICKRYQCFYDDGKPRDAAEIYRHEKCYPAYLNYARTLIDSLQASSDKPVLFVFGKPASRFIDDSFSRESTAMINGSKWSFVHLPHPLFLRRYADKNAPINAYEVIERASIEHNVRVDLSKLKAWIDTRWSSTVLDPVILGVDQELTEESIVLIDSYVSQARSRRTFVRSPEYRAHMAKTNGTDEKREFFRRQLAERHADPAWHAMWYASLIPKVKAVWADEEYKKRMSDTSSTHMVAQWKIPEFRVQAQQKISVALQAKADHMSEQEKKARATHAAATRASRAHLKAGYECLADGCMQRHQSNNGAWQHFRKHHPGLRYDHRATLAESNWKEAKEDNRVRSKKEIREQKRRRARRELPCPVSGCKQVYKTRACWKPHFEKVHPGMDLQAPLDTEVYDLSDDE
ncbi:hypothetical protein OHC33_009804 [Knufia fluminis]|uniref:C2H2-type domain-containing protein n=1 Tax=Knufia fluminis TaxID=191047 RepID=A0AAN8E9P1_9EURO|nr:hypothetical protein OHC33_009804 [Knufia fluminis]